MLRESLAPSSREVSIYSPNTTGNVWLAWRLDTGGTSAINANGGTYPFWVKLIRYGDYTYKYSSTDGINWTPSWGAENAGFTGLPATVYIGFFQDHGSGGNYTNTDSFDNVSITPYTPPVTIPGKLSTTWIGNTFGAGADFENIQLDVDGMYVSPDGTCYANTWGLDVNRMCGVYKSGACEGYLPVPYNGGASVASDGTYLYYGAETSTTTGSTTVGQYGVWRVNQSTLAAAPFTGGIKNGDLLQIGTKSAINAPGNIWGLACNPAAQLLYASDNLTGKINLVTTTTMTVGSSWQLPTGYVPYGLCWDATDSLLWAAVQNTSTGARQIWAYNSSGIQQTALTITGATKPVSMAYYSGHLYVADNGPDQNIKAYGSLTTTPSLWTTYGATGGAFSGTGATIGTAGPWRFSGLTSIGIDASGNLYVAFNGRGPNLNEDNLYQNGGTGLTMESYNLATQARNWSIHSMEFMDCINIDPANESTAYGAAATYGLNWANTTPGTEWSLSAFNLNWLKYTDDYRATSGNTNHNMTKAIRINGQPYLVMGDVYHLDLFRFNSSTDGQVAIPCAELYGTTIWTDTNGNGHRDAGETATVSTLGYMSPDDIDSGGNIYGVLSNGFSIHLIYKFIPTFLGNGVPQYSPSSKQTWDYTALSTADTDTFTAVNLVNYDSANDTMYLLGFTNAHPKLDSWSGQGAVLKSYSHWSTTPTFNWASVLPITDTGSPYTSQVIEAMTNAGQYMFLQCQQNYTTLVLSKATGGVVGTLTPDPNVVGEMGEIWVDYYRGVSAYQRTNGEYIITVEDDIYNKSIVYRWTPWTDYDIGNVGTTPGSSSWDPSTNTFTITGSGLGTINTTTDACHFTYLPVSGNFTLIGQVTNVNCPANIYARPGLMVRNDLTPGSQYASMLITPVANDRVGAFFRVTAGGSTSGGSNLGTAPLWLKLVRSGSTFTEFFSSDSVTWTQYGGATTVSMNTNAYVGFEASSLSTAYQATMTVTNVSLTSP